MNPQTPMAPPRWAALSKELDAAASLLAHGIRILLVDGYSVLDAPAVLACLATGAEKLLKLTVGMVAIEETGTWPDKKTMAERYLAAEALLHLAEHATEGAKLPKELKKSLKANLLDEKNDLAIWSLADDGWRTVLRKRAALSNDDDRSLNTPKSAQVREFFRRNVGIRDITSSWRWHKNPPDRTTMLLDGRSTFEGPSPIAVRHLGGPQEARYQRSGPSPAFGGYERPRRQHLPFRPYEGRATRAGISLNLMPIATGQGTDRLSPAAVAGEQRYGGRRPRSGPEMSGTLGGVVMIAA
jgi:hypothetical protein